MTATHEPFVQATRYEVSMLPDTNMHRRQFTLYVEARGNHRWAVTSGAHGCLGSDGAWEYEMNPSERSDEWIATHRFALDVALDLAKDAARNITFMGHTVAEALAEGASA